MTRKKDPNQDDILSFVACPHCNIDIVLGRFHVCRKIIKYKHYVSSKLGLELVWIENDGWVLRSRSAPDEPVTFAYVANNVNGPSVFVPKEK